MTKNNHIHKFKRDVYSTGRKYYYCTGETCNFKIDVKHSLGKLNLCNSCNTPFKMNEYSIRAANPKCMDCIKRRTIKKTGEVDDIIQSPTRTNNIAETIQQVDSILEMQRKVNNLTIKEYNPDDESDAL